MAISLTERVKLVIERFNSGLSRDPSHQVKMNQKQFDMDLDNILRAFIEEGISAGQDLECKRYKGVDVTPQMKGALIDKTINDIKGHSQYQPINKLTSNYNIALTQNAIILDEIKQQDKAHLREQFRLMLFRVLTAIGIASALVFMGLLANQLGVQIGLPLFKMM